MKAALITLAQQLDGEFSNEDTLRHIYATDASAYRELPLGVAWPKSTEDLKCLIRFAKEHNTSLIPRTAGTSLAGQVVGSGIVVDVSRHFTHILEINAAEGWVKVQPGVVRDELNLALAPYGLYYGPETSTANRAMIGGMVGNNSCGANSVVYGSARDHLLEANAILSNGEEVTFGALTTEEVTQKTQGATLEARLYQQAIGMLNDESVRQEIAQEYPKPEIPRRNTGYAIDLLALQQPFSSKGEAFNFCSLLAGSEGTLAFFTELKLSLNPLPPAHSGLVCLHCVSIEESLRATLVAIKHAPSAVELMDHYILERTKTNIEHQKNRFFVKGDPAAILVIELRRDTAEQLYEDLEALKGELAGAGLGYHAPVVSGPEIKKVWQLRKAGLGLLSNIPGDAKPAPVIEDTAVAVADLPSYIAEFNEILAKYQMDCVHYAHAGSGELHLRPVLNLKTSQGQADFRMIAEEIAALVKKYRGSLSGEHGDGRLRGEFIKQMIGEANYKRLEEVKSTWDPQGIFNPGKIVSAPTMDTSLRFQPDHKTPELATKLNWSKNQGVVRAAELCNGSGDCRKTQLIGGTMCPSYQATRQEKETTRARANVLREYLNKPATTSAFDHPEIKEVLDLCLSCKGCKKECPSNVDMAKLKAEFTYQYQKLHGVPFRSRLMAQVSAVNRLASTIAPLYNHVMSSPLGSLAKKALGFHPNRSLPKVQGMTVRKWYQKNYQAPHTPVGTLAFFCDEFTNYLDAPIGIKAIKLWTRLGYHVWIPKFKQSGRAHISKGLLDQAQHFAEQNIQCYQKGVPENTPLVGLEPSALLCFRDEYPDLVSEELKSAAEAIGKNAFLFEEFMEREIAEGRITAEQFKVEKKVLKYHGHCYQKALSSLTKAKKTLSLPVNYEVQMIPSGCCGMAGSFGYEAEHYEVSMTIGEMVLFPSVRSSAVDEIIVAPGHSCRHQIYDGTKKEALHPVEVLLEALKPE